MAPTVKITMTWLPGLQTLTKSPAGMIGKDNYQRGLAVQALAKRNLSRSPVRVDTGNLRGSINIKRETIALGFMCSVSTNVKYAMFVHDGTGIYGPRGAMIRPKNGRYLVFRTKRGKLVFARQVRGMRPNPFLKDALPIALT